MNVFEKAIIFAVNAHSGMTRKGGDTPYIVHPMEVATIAGCFTADEVEFNIDAKDHARITCGTAKFTVLGLPAPDFPEAATFDTIRKIEVKQSDFKRMISSIVYAVSADDSRKVLTGILASISTDTATDIRNLTLVATDGKRMAIQESNPQLIDGDDGDAIIPLKAMSELRRLLEGDETLTIEFGDKFCCFTAANFTLKTKLIDGNYPKYRQVVPKDFAQVVELPVQLLLSKIETVALMLSEANGFIILTFEDNTLHLKASSAEVGEGSDLLETTYNGEVFEVSFNPVFLADPLRNTDAEMVRFKLNDRLSPVTLEAGEGFVYVIMPLRTK